mmetsp:Transcript_3449/g.8521  ORF Transcript_3449/g.8521 Transcript_3449/m.8521 type:complete len:218 (-) Transcript_3449:140-793(-)|eukprot:CAMPEP_0202056202 /NCGR_PEP_ID=MMETSP0963-20130614/22911_1 /ASSEMBLY_ACC=CAM_ASM_000494 /TAXON_ID=4773 /ORGANISM="Schizochytrium aggregatum, Strain ATCC28209" /LENGTH=217 /DNA_ID=CAMNT_0048621907 /DNA_START=44 /DNA_END=697 /DNA_ORIENTATION=-
MKRPRSGSVSAVPLSVPFRQIEAEATFSLPPAYIERAHQGANEMLNARLLEFDERFNGVLLAYSNVKVKGGLGMVFCETPEIQYRVSFSGLVFTPLQGMILSGRVSHLTAGHITLLFCNAFQVSIARARVPDKYEFSESFDQYVNSENSEDVIKVGTEVRFMVEAVRSAGAFDIEGSMMGMDSAEPKHIKIEDEDQLDQKVKKDKKKKRKKKLTSDE